MLNHAPRKLVVLPVDVERKNNEMRLCCRSMIFQTRPVLDII